MIEEMKRKAQKHYPFEKFHGYFLTNLKTAQFVVPFWSLENVKLLMDYKCILKRF